MQGTIIKSRSKKCKIPPRAKKQYEGVYSAEIVGGEGNDAPQAEIADLRLDSEHEMRKWREAIVCPKCATKIE
jgi:hypothetical protein